MDDFVGSILRGGIRVVGSIFSSWILYNILLFVQSYIPRLSDTGFYSLLVLGILIIFYILVDSDSVNSILIIGIWVSASIFLSWILYNILLIIQSYIPSLSGMGFDSLLALGTLGIFYILKEAFGFEFKLPDLP